MSTASWENCHKQNDCSTSLEKLSKLKESHPVQVAEYAVAQSIECELAFNLWVRYILKKRDRIIFFVELKESINLTLSSKR